MGYILRLLTYQCNHTIESKLLNNFPKEGGEDNPSDRIIPFLPGKILFGRSHIRQVALERCKAINEYCKKLILLPQHISEKEEVLNFFETKPDDVTAPVSQDKKEDQKADAISEPLQLEQYVSIADYEKQQRNEVSLTAGACVEVIEKNSSGWWLVSVNDEQGWVPASFLERVDGKKDELTVKMKAGVEKYLVIQPYKAQNSDELDLEKGMIVDVTEKSLDGWWKLRCKNRDGWGPAACLKRVSTVVRKKLVSSNPISPVQVIGRMSEVSDLITNPTSSANFKSQYTASNLEEDIYGNADIIAKFKPPPRRAFVIKAKKKPARPPTLPPVKKQYVTIADFTDSAGDGLSFKQDAIVQVLQKHSTGWWYVSIEGNEGWAPESYIKEVTAVTHSSRVSSQSNNESRARSSSPLSSTVTESGSGQKSQLIGVKKTKQTTSGTEGISLKSNIRKRPTIPSKNVENKSSKDLKKPPVRPSTPPTLRPVTPPKPTSSPRPSTPTRSSTPPQSSRPSTPPAKSYNLPSKLQTKCGVQLKVKPMTHIATQESSSSVRQNTGPSPVSSEVKGANMSDELRNVLARRLTAMNK
ncbi:SH3 and PX domain-containing protein 2A isoform X2 [Lingula anatina]|uniref:SH3 and PX domain-containing protein 2A isoform X2 n=1 Tax=Lingula anatina TaxID=7574 RepID=A0A1S3II56_LINAN|nr:SH3 and PX domain-containing protein 2A isoform X2 [Lingula anatina]|eukprot:XP_013397808.1 SH3 and PX domain-containing protein 2A isoform X2 [Lingula anatina]